MNPLIVITGRFPLRRETRRPPRRRAQRGVALIEALVSILIFSFGVLGLMGLEARAITFSVDAEDRNRAAVFASEIASTLWLSGSISAGATTANINAWNTSVKAANAPQTGLPNGTVTVTPVAGTANAADIVITWQSPAHSADASETTSQLTTRVILP
jgi:type IV pilus assembly protein PilV